jgi:phosphoribosyl-ATP pyrophosphohydrolase/phosphoribosyl-AMP cyclohydrolase
MYKKIISGLDCENRKKETILSFGIQIDKNGGDELYVYNATKNETIREEFFEDIKSLIKEIDIPVMVGTFVKRFEDIKKALYTGAKYCVINYSTLEDKAVIIEGSQRFPDRIILDLRNTEMDSVRKNIDFEAANIHGIIISSDSYEEWIGSISIKDIEILLYEHNSMEEITIHLQDNNVDGVIGSFHGSENIIDIKNSLKEANIEVNTLVSRMDFKEFKLNSDGLIPVITQDYKTGEVLMLAYMNEEAFEKTLTRGLMTYYSRSRNELWIKGDTSSHYQYVKSLDIDCDKDTLLAKVKQIGAACHTGSRTCFYTNLVKKEYDDTNPLTVLNNVYDIIKDRKANPKEGSYTNYLFDKGIDKILKKCGEEATEIIIAAKNPSVEDLKYEISDFMYHLMVLMAECDLDWSDILKELANR